MNKELFQDCINRLRSVPPEKFDMRTWIQWIPGTGMSRVESLALNSCETAGCVLGWCCVWYPDTFKFRPGPGYIFLAQRPAITDYCAAAQLFGITHDWAYRLFSPATYGEAQVTSSVVADRMQRYLDGYISMETVE